MNGATHFNNVAIVEGDELVRESLQWCVNQTPGFSISGAFASLEPALHVFDRCQPDLVILEPCPPGATGVDVMRRLVERFPKLPTVVITSSRRETDVRETINLGVQAYLLKPVSLESLRAALQAASAGLFVVPANLGRNLAGQRELPVATSPAARHLSPQERQILHLLARRGTNAMMARKLRLSSSSVDTYLRRLYSKLGVHARREAGKARQTQSNRPAT